MFGSSAGDWKDFWPESFTLLNSPISDDDVAGAPVDDPFDTIAGSGIVLTPVPKQ
jgi:hypothetical protein